jgi:hypothetical protein
MRTRVFRVRSGAVVALVFACNGGTGDHHPDAPTDGPAATEACAITVSSALITGSSGNGNCTGDACCSATLVTADTIDLGWLVVSDPGYIAVGRASCVIQPGVAPQTLGFEDSTPGATGCDIEVTVDDGSAAVDAWAGSATSTIDVTVTELPPTGLHGVPVGGTIMLQLQDGSGNGMTVSGTFDGVRRRRDHRRDVAVR